MGSIDQPFNPISVALGAEATFVARTHDMDRGHMQEMFRRAHDHQGSAIVEVFQNCNVFNDGAFNAITKKDARDAMLINLTHGEPVRFGVDGERGVMIVDGTAKIVDVAEVGIDALHVHDETAPDPSVAFAISRRAVFEPPPLVLGGSRPLPTPGRARRPGPGATVYDAIRLRGVVTWPRGHSRGHAWRTSIISSVWRMYNVQCIKKSFAFE